jgi:hypothetical protein
MVLGILAALVTETVGLFLAVLLPSFIISIVQLRFLVISSRFSLVSSSSQQKFRRMYFNNLYQFQLCTLLLASQARATFWLNQLDSYDSLPYCAEGPISSIVRDMVSGCGDGGRATSYSCFCTRSSSRFESIIATAVAKECSHWGTEASSATSIFHEYCQLGNGVLASTAVEDLPTG